jgi:hypothetical protein
MYFILTNEEDDHFISDDHYYSDSFLDPAYNYYIFHNNYSKINSRYTLKSLNNYSYYSLYNKVIPKYIRCVLFYKDTHLEYGIHLGKMILSDRYYLLDPKTIKKFNLSIDKSLINIAFFYGDINFLEWLKKNKSFSKLFLQLSSEYNCIPLYYASIKCYIHVFEWWKNSGLPLKYSELVLNCASEKGFVKVLDWWKNSGLPLKYTAYALNNASFNGHVNVLEWWLKSGLPLKYNESALNTASFNGHVNVLDWWLKSGLELKYTEYALETASYNGHVNVLTWWRKSGLELKYDESTLNMIYQKGNMDIIKWFYNNNLMPWLDRLYYYIYFRLLKY